MGEWSSRRPRNFAAGCSDLKLNLAAARFRGNTVYGLPRATYIAMFIASKGDPGIFLLISPRLHGLETSNLVEQ